ncbi:hypothetical protein [Asticcacaulis sp. AND118]|uniref:hypothetical protein n=1 Tax=Asticcacaulis sp. AND118 TaxID=2840468 RepID=UPI001D000C42|nr:hypothetical protein [Asticcacaulis sp. AND118]UDF05029.1 hypothetical protein LH365_16685 [Asticcacaulis sp. AND118]
MRFMKYRGLTRLRFDAYLTADQDASRVNTVKMMQKHAKLNNIKLRPILAFPFAFGDRTDFGQYPKGDADALYRQGYNRTYAFVNQFKNDIDTYELGNELNLLVRDKSGQPLWGKGWTPAEFNTPLMNDWAIVLKGASDAIDKINKDNGLNIRRVLNTTSTHFGFVEFMEQKGVKFEVISYHYYERLGTDPNKYWGTFNLFQKLASYKRPIFFNEVNCGEIYDPNFENKWYGNLVENCNKSLNNTLNYMFNQKYANIEEIDIYELIDHPERGGAEGRFGLNYGLSEWKITQLIAAFYAGGTITEGERAYITRRGYPAIQK